MFTQLFIQFILKAYANHQVSHYLLNIGATNRNAYIQATKHVNGELVTVRPRVCILYPKTSKSQAADSRLSIYNLWFNISLSMVSHKICNFTKNNCKSECLNQGNQYLACVLPFNHHSIILSPHTS